ncbi:MAG: Wzz/FepE/Etk N-terminal domain-containing protein [Pseudomonadota bacterium]|nr:Wzz/FepE/Etk N-terminal domain-containing protein [Pseudomonadota bacterium]
MQNSQERAAYDDEISLVDLAATFIRRRRIFYACFALVTLLGVVYALIQPDKYEYVTLLESAEKAGSEFIEKPAATVAIIQNRWIPAAASRYQADNEKLLPFKLEASNPENTGLIRIASEASVENSDVVKTIHSDLAQSVMERQQQLLEAQRNSLKNQLASIERVVQSLQTLEGGENTATALAAAIQKQAQLESELEATQPASVIVTARQSNGQKGTSSRLIVVLAAMLGGMLGVFLAFFAEFAGQVRNSLHGTDKD